MGVRVRVRVGVRVRVRVGVRVRVRVQPSMERLRATCRAASAPSSACPLVVGCARLGVGLGLGVRGWG